MTTPGPGPRLVLFDFDGTLVDSQHSIVAAFSMACRDHGIPGIDPASIRRHIGLPLVVAVAANLPEAHRARAGEIAESYKLAHRALAKDSDHDPLFPGAFDAVAALKRAGALLGIATGKGRRGLTATLEKRGLLGAFDVLRSADDGPGKPDPWMVHSALGEMGVGPGDAIVVGDTSFDMHMARNAGVPAIGVGWGYHPEAELLAAGALSVVPDFTALLAALRGRGFPGMKRWYKQAEAAPAPGGFGVMLDGKPINTPMRTPILVPVRALALAIAGEWGAQGETVKVEEMRLTRLAATALDRIAPNPAPAIAEIAGYAATDLLCHRAEGPDELRRRQDASWQPVLDWAARRYGAALSPVQGVIPAAQPKRALVALHDAVAAHAPMHLAGLHGVTVSSGSLLLGLALAEGEIDVERAWAAADLDEAWQRERWGEDALAAKRRAGVEAELRAAARFLDLLRAG